MSNYIIITGDPLASAGVPPVTVSGAAPTTGQAIVATSATAATWQTVGSGGGGPPTGSAGGVLSGTYPNPTISLTSNSSLTGTLPAANQAVQTLTGDVIGNTGANTLTLAGDVTGRAGTTAVAKITGSAGVVTLASTGNVLTWAAATTAPGLAQTSTSSATQGANITITPQQSTQATNNGGGNVVIALQTPTGTGTEGMLQFTRGGTTFGLIGPTIGTPSQIAIYTGNVTPSSSNYILNSTGSTTAVNASTNTFLAVGASGILGVTSAAISMYISPLEWVAATATPKLTQLSAASTSAGSGAAGAVMTVVSQAGQAATGASNNGGAGGNLVLSAGLGGTSGSATAGKGGVVAITGGQTVSVVSKSTTYSVDTGSTTADYVILTTGNAFTITLPAPTSGRVLIIKDAAGNAATQNKTISHNASETIDGATTYVLNLNYSSVVLVSDGTNWFSTSVASGTAV